MSFILPFLIPFYHLSALSDFEICFPSVLCLTPYDMLVLFCPPSPPLRLCDLPKMSILALKRTPGPQAGEERSNFKVGVVRAFFVFIVADLGFYGFRVQEL